MDKPRGEWNTFEITMKGDRLWVKLNGEEVIKDAQLPGVPRVQQRICAVESSLLLRAHRAISPMLISAPEKLAEYEWICCSDPIMMATAWSQCPAVPSGGWH